MATGNFSNRFGKRPSSGKPLGRAGTGEESLRGYTGLRRATAVYPLGIGLTDDLANVHRILNEAAIGTPGTFPRSLTKIATGRTVSGVPVLRKFLSIPMALTARLTAAAAPTGTHSVTIRIMGANQFGEPTQEDLTITANAGGAGGLVNGVRIFERVDAVLVIAESNSAAGDTVRLHFSATDNPTFGLPGRIRDVDDVTRVVVQLLTNGIAVLGGADITMFATNSEYVVSVKEQSINTGTFNLGSDGGAAGAILYITVLTSLGMDQGYTRPAGQKVVKAY